MGKLSARQEAFVAEYVKDRNATRAAIRAGYSERTARSIGHENLTKPDIAAAVERALLANPERPVVGAAALPSNELLRGRGTSMTEQTGAASPEGETIEDLDRQAREALDRLADKREELERQHRATELAEGTRQEREEERRRLEAPEAKEREERRRLEALERMGKERLRLEERAEEQAATLVSTLEELIAFDRRHRRALAPGGFSVFEAPPDLAGEVSAWFRCRFGEVVPGLGSDVRAPSFGKPGPSLPERDPLTETPARVEEGASG